MNLSPHHPVKAANNGEKAIRIARVRLPFKSAPLHDIGKIGIPDSDHDMAKQAAAMAHVAPAT